MKVVLHTTIAILSAAFLLLGCDELQSIRNDFEVSPSGIQYKIYSADNRGERLQVGDIVNMHYQLWIRDSQITSTRKTKPIRIPILEPVKGAGPDINEVYLQAHEFDSIEIRIPLDSIPMQAPTYRQYDSNAQYLTVRVQLLGKYDENKLIESYIQDQGYYDLPSKTTPSGVRVIWHRKGTGQPIAIGDSVVLHLKGSLLEDDMVFTNTWAQGQSLGFYIDSSSVGLPGLLNGITALRGGDSATLILPSTTAFGPVGQPIIGIPPFSPIVFEAKIFEVVKSESAPN